MEKCDLKWFQIKSQNFKSNPNQITRFPNQIIILQIKSLYVIQSWFKSNHDLDLPITGADNDEQVALQHELADPGTAETDCSVRI